MKSGRGIRDYFKFIIAIFLVWRTFLLVAMLLAFSLLPLYSNNFLGGGYRSYNKFFYILPWANFDGEHYLSIANYGYKNLEQAFFPVYPKMISFFLGFFSNTILNAALIGLVLSNLFFIAALIILWKLLNVDYSKNFSVSVLMLLLVFPTSFYFGAVYSESIFLFLTVASFYFARRKKWFLSAVFAGVASATRVFGLLLLPALIIEGLLQRENPKKLIWLILAPSGFLIYIFYQYLSVGDPFAFYHYQLIVGPQHQTGIVFLPQIFIRYFKIFMSVNPFSLTSQSLILEILTGIIFFILPIFGYFKKIRLSYLFFALAGMILPTIQGSFSSLPRYILVFFPSFIALNLIIEPFPKFAKAALFVISLLGLGFETMLFIRGYWVA